MGIRQLASSVLYGRRLIQTSRTVQSSTAKTDRDSRISLRWDDIWILRRNLKLEGKVPALKDVQIGAIGGFAGFALTFFLW